MIPITLRQLRYFDALVRHRHFGDAARAVAISQPALSMQIRELETTIGVPLVERRARRVEITAAGHEVARRASAILQGVAELADIGQVHGQGEPAALTGRLTLGIIPTVAPYLLPTLLGRLSQSAPDLDLVVRESQTERLLDDIAAAKLDLALLALPAERPGLVTLPLIAEPFLMLRRRPEDSAPVPEDGEMAEANLGMLLDERLLLLEEGHCFRDQALSFCTGGTGALGPAGLSRTGVTADATASMTARDTGLDAGPGMGETLSVSSLSTLAQMAEAGMGVTLIPAMAARIEVRAETLECLSFGPAGPSRTLGLVWRATSPLAQRFETLGNVIHDAVATLLGAAAIPVRNDR
ncbi:MAG: LysR substrate-binding domain-containing protein [Pseudomonadota bacterium]